MTATDHTAVLTAADVDRLVPVRDGVASPGDTLYFVTASGREVRPFVLDREERPEFPARDRFLVAVGSGLYDADSCYLDLRRAEAEAEADRIVGERMRAAREELERGTRLVVK